MQAVKLEGGADIAHEVSDPDGGRHSGHGPYRTSAAVDSPNRRVQSAGQAGGGHPPSDRDAKALEEAGAFAIVLELVTDGAAEAVTRALKIPTIGIGAGAACDGQVLVYHDMIRYASPYPKQEVRENLRRYRHDHPRRHRRLRARCEGQNVPRSRAQFSGRVGNRRAAVRRRGGETRCGSLRRSPNFAPPSPKAQAEPRWHGRIRADDGLSARRPRQFDPPLGGGERAHRRQRLRQSAAVRPEGRFRAVPARCRAGQAGVRSGGGRSVVHAAWPKCIRVRRDARHGRRSDGAAVRGVADPAISTASARSSPNCFISSCRIEPISA